jgi:glycosyltransferase involved in cell wall biosynthesis
LCLGASPGETVGSAPWPRRQARRALDGAFAPVTRLSPAWRLWKVGARFDFDAALRLPAADHLIAFNGTSLAQFRAARRARYQSLALVSATAHMRRVVRRHAESRRAYPLERSWATRMLERNLREYAQADRIYVSSRYVWESFLEEGLPESALAWFPLTPHPRYRPEPAAARAQQPDTFDVLYVGALTVDKGVALLVDAVRRLPFADLRLVLVGGWKTRGMRGFLERARAQDARIEISAGDPLPRLRAGRLYVHAAYCDGFAYAAAEALACGLPVIASADTGMKDLIDEAPGNGLVLPTGDLDALSEAIAAAYRGEILHGRGAPHG